MISNLLFLLLESLRGWVRHKRILFPTLVTVLLGALLLEGVLTALVVTRRISPVPYDSWKVDIFLSEAASDRESLEKLQEILLREPGVQSFHLVTREEAAHRFRAEFGSDALDMVGGEVLPISFEVWPEEEWKNMFRFRPWLRSLEQLPGVDLVTSSVEALEWIAERRARVEALVGIAALLLLAALYVILGNAVRMALLARTLVIENMKYVGASTSFIMLPFLFESLMIGLVGGGAAWGIWELILFGARRAMPGWEEWFAPLGAVGFAPALLLALIALWTTIRAVRSHLWSGARV